MLEARLAPAEARPTVNLDAEGIKPLVHRPPARSEPEHRPAPPETRVAEPDATPAAAAEMPQARSEPSIVEGPPGLELPQIEDPEFYPARMLDQYPKPVAEVELRYPPRAGTEEMSGTVTLLLLIDELGIVVDASVVEADPPGYFEDAAIAAFKSVLFTAGQRDGKTVKSRLVVQVSFDAKTESLRR